MADLMNNDGQSSIPLTSRPATDSPSTNIRGPRQIMEERQRREARQREERDRNNWEHAEAEARTLEERRRREAEPGRVAAGAGATDPGALPAVNSSSSKIRGLAAMGEAMAGRPTTDNATRTLRGTLPSTHAQPAQRHSRMASAPTHGTPGATGAPTSAGPGAQALPEDGRGRPSFSQAQAFERWETLSAHWEGLTNFWLHRLQQESEEISNDPVSMQLSRQVTDLSSSGANLFHALVELQKLRASSERKFKRWFDETRADMERNREVTGMLEAALEAERRGRAEAIREAVEREQGTSKLQRQLNEMRKELSISKDEARRAWEELGRREQEERDRTHSLQQGLPTVVGGVQVVPMAQGVSRHNTQREGQPYEDTSGYSSPPSMRQEYTQAPAVQPVVTSPGGNPSYQQPPGIIQHQGSYGSEGTFSEEDYETPASQSGTFPSTAAGAHPQQPQYGATPEYTGEGYSAPGWEPRHHHPTRLSDVIEEEEERSRTSASTRH